MRSTDLKNEINFYNEDCLQALKKLKDNSYDLSIVDPPYGINLADWMPTRQSKNTLLNFVE